jgi:hypothetical protein
MNDWGGSRPGQSSLAVEIAVGPAPFFRMIISMIGTLPAYIRRVRGKYTGKTEG